MKTSVFAVWKTYAFLGPSHIIHLFSTKDKAEAKVKELKAAAPPEDKPDYDSYGQTEGIDYSVEEREVE